MTNQQNVAGARAQAVQRGEVLGGCRQVQTAITNDGAAITTSSSDELRRDERTPRRARQDPVWSESCLMERSTRLCGGSPASGAQLASEIIRFVFGVTVAHQGHSALHGSI
jgi:hypothetical protein